MNEKVLQCLNNDISLYPSNLEVEFPHIFNKIFDLWNTDQLDKYLNEVVFDTRGDRLGFPNGTGNELLKLLLHRLKIDSEEKDINKKDYWDWII